ncbi:hypothetical protein JMJ56_01580 [Belnapia sp. T18]|uniref:Tetratricopeptide repeat-containing protein n=1 Tax=Belnapia arida TaxID=2804533 RepID=A0ABS1U048_9PROT|nr:hypothetical protein [Belnapia arida]MBL6076676.1 hypothetical protein [Belnapia arida]
MRWAPLLALLLAAPAAWAQEAVGVRVGNHPGHGRLVFDWPAPPQYRVEQAGDAVVLYFPPGSAIDLSGARRLPRNMAAVAAEGEGIRIALKPGVRARIFRVGPKLVVDALSPPAEPAPVAQAAPARAEPAPEVVAPPMAPAASPVLRSAPPVPAMPVLTPPRPDALAVRPLPRGGGILLPYPAGTGLAVLRRGGEVLALFDSGEALDLTGLRTDPIFAALEVEALGGATLLRLPLPSPGLLKARREPNGWVLEAHRPAEGQGAAGRSVGLEVEGGVAARLMLRAGEPGRVVPITDPESGLPLLVGTVRAAGQSMPIWRRLPELDLPPTLLGVAVLARADQVTMRATAGGFLVGAANGPLALDAAAAEMPNAEAMTRSFDLPRMPTPRLLERLRALQASIAAAPPLNRLALRRAAAETLLALGMPQEAQAMVELTRGEDPEAARDARLNALAGAAALLAGRLPQAAALHHAELPETDELNLWQTLLLAAEGEAREAVPRLASALPVLFDYPEGLRSRLLPLAAQSLAEAGAVVPLRQVLEKAGPMPELALPRAMLAEASGDAEAALAGYEQIALGRDRLARARALRRAVELRLATHKIDAAQAARALEATLFAWRGDGEEAAARIRLAELRRAAGDARGALALLRETEALFPERGPALRAAINAAFVAALEHEPPLDAVALFDAYPDLLPKDADGQAAMLVLADRLVALDLADRAAALLGQAVGRSAGAPRAALGLRQGVLHLSNGDAAAALKALQESNGEMLPDPLMQARAVLAAQAQSRLGRLEEAVVGLKALGSAGAAALSQLLAERQDWAGAAAALADHLRAALPAAPAPLEEPQQRLLLRHAAMLALAGDEAGLVALRRSYVPRLPEGALAAAFALLTADQLRGLADLPRLQKELLLFQTIPPWLEALRAGGPVTR